MTTYKIGVLYGDGIGPEIVRSALAVVKAALRHAGGPTLHFIELPMGWDGIKRFDDPLPPVTIDTLKTCDGWLMGPHDCAAYPPEHIEKLNPSGKLRHLFDLYANIRPNKALPDVQCIASGADLVIVRENTEGFYPDRSMYKGSGEVLVTPDLALVTGVFSRKAAERIAHTAFRLAMKRRKKVTIVHKANVIQLGTGLFRDTCYEVGKQYPEIKIDDFHVDAIAARLVRSAADFDVIVTTNMFGDILSDLAGELTGSLGLAASINANDSQAMAQAVHGSAPDIAGKNIANPVGILLSAVMLFNWLAERHHDEDLRGLAQTIEQAVASTLAAGIRTPDMGGAASTTDFTAAVAEHLPARL